MKNSLRTICLLLVLIMTAGLLTACPNNAKTSQKDDRTDFTTRETETQTKSTIDEPTQTIETVNTADPDKNENETPTPSETSSSASTSGTTAKPAAKALGKVKVTDAYKSTYTSPEWGKVTSRIPKITIDGVSTSAVNKEIAKLIPKAKSAAKNKFTYYHYSYYVGKTYVSIIVSYPDYNDTGKSYIYNISRKTGKRLSKKQMLKTLGISSKKFNSRVKKAIKKCYNKMGNPGNDKYFKSQYKKAMSSKTIKKAIPYVNTKGKISFMINEMPVPGGADFANHYGTC